MKVLFLTHNFPRYAGDAPGSFLLRLALALAREGVVVNVLAPSAPGLASTGDVGGIAVTRFRYAPKAYETLAYTGTMASDVRASWSARAALAGLLASSTAASVRAIRRLSPDVIHAHWWFPSGVAATFATALGGPPLVTTLHGTDLRMARDHPVSRPAFRRVVARSAVLSTVSSWLAAEVRRIAPAAQPHVAPMPVAAELFSSGGSRSADRLLFVGRLNAQKGAADALRALAAMRLKLSLDIVGDGPDRRTLELLAAELDVADRVRWHGVQPQPALAAFYRAAAALIAPYQEEGLGLVAVEAMFCETPVVGYASGGMVDVVRSGTTGVLVPPGDSAALAAALDKLLADDGRRAAIASAGLESARAAFSPEVVARRYAYLYRLAIAR